MLKLSQFITEQKNTHMEHLEDMIFNDGVEGARSAINSLRSLRDMLSGHSKTKVNVTVKWDGAPAVFAGIDPSDGKFFVAKKGIFNKNPQLYKTNADIDQYLSGDLNKKFKIALEHFSKLGIKRGVYQGDLMFTSGDIKTMSSEGVKYYTFQPNTILYAVPVNSNLGRKIKKAKVGIVWHTTYSGNSIENMKASFGKNIVSSLKSSSNVWMDDATYRDVSGNASFTQEENANVTEILSKAGKLFRGINSTTLNTIANDEELKQKIKAYNNTYVRVGSKFPETKKHVKGLYDYITNWYQKQIDSKKTDDAKQKWKEKRDIVLKNLFTDTQSLSIMFELMFALIEAKQLIIDKLNNASSMGTFLRTKNGLKTTNQEGFVAIDNLSGGAVKIVDRLEFSRANFSNDILKGWNK